MGFEAIGAILAEEFGGEAIAGEILADGALAEGAGAGVGAVAGAEAGGAGLADLATLAGEAGGTGGAATGVGFEIGAGGAEGAGTSALAAGGTASGDIGAYAGVAGSTPAAGAGAGLGTGVGEGLATAAPSFSLPTLQQAGGIAQLFSGVQGLSQANKVGGYASQADPFGSYRGGFAQQLAELMKNPGSVTSTPGYKAGMDAGEQALTRNLASQGLTGSGTAAQAITQFGAQYQGTAFDKLFAQLSGLSGANQNGAGTAAQITAGAANTRNSSINTAVKGIPAVFDYMGGP